METIRNNFLYFDIISSGYSLELLKHLLMSTHKTVLRKNYPSHSSLSVARLKLEPEKPQKKGRFLKGFRQFSLALQVTDIL